MWQRLAPGGAPVPTEPQGENSDYRQTGDESFEGSAVGQNSGAQAENHGIAGTAEMQDAGQSPDDERAANGSHSPAPIAVHPVTGNGQPEQRKHTTKARPLRRQPALKSPQHRGTHDGDAQENANPRLAEQLTQSQHRTLSRRIYRS